MYFYKLERVSIICFVLLVVFTTGENGHFRYEAVFISYMRSSLIQLRSGMQFHELAKFHAAVVSRFMTICLTSSQELKKTKLD